MQALCYRNPRRNVFPSGGMAEWFKAPVLKTGVPQGTGGSNPSPSAKFFLDAQRCLPGMATRRRLGILPAIFSCQNFEKIAASKTGSFNRRQGGPCAPSRGQAKRNRRRQEPGVSPRQWLPASRNEVPVPRPALPMPRNGLPACFCLVTMPRTRLPMQINDVTIH